MEMTFDKMRVPLTLLSSGTVRVTGTGVPLESIVISHRQGYTPQDIKRQYPTLDIADIYLVIGYSLRHPEEVEQYMKEWEEDWDRFEEEMLSQPGAREYYARLWEQVRQEELEEDRQTHLAQQTKG